MEQFKSWLKQPFGKKLKKLHSWNAWIVLLLAVTGILLYLPFMRGLIASFRVGLKEFHIILGLISVFIILLYLPLIGRHVKQIRRKKSQYFNLWLVLFLLIGWSISGIILWQERNLPKEWTTVALIWHDLLTWIGVPYTIYHSISRSRWLKTSSKPKKLAPVSKEISRDEEEQLTADQYIKRRFTEPPFSRRTFLRGMTIILLIISVGPYFYRWVKRIFDDGGTRIDDAALNDGNRMIPEPTPNPQSVPPVGGGAKGNFRVYTVTDIPSFSSDTWKFALGGLVDKPVTYNWEEFLKIPRQFQVSDFHCVTGWSVFNVTWEGIRLSDFLDQAGVKSQAKYVKFYSGDGVYTDTLTVQQARMQDVVIAVLMDGKPIPQKLGGPIRLVVPKMYAYKSVKWLQAIELIEEEHIGYWEERGYLTDAWLNRKP
ncbi:molybdopterin-dependent oxidoreductase [Bacillus sp. AK128]